MSNTGNSDADFRIWVPCSCQALNITYIYSIYNIFKLLQKITKDAGEKVAKATAPFSSVIQSYGYN